MAVALKIGKKLISPKRARDRKGKEGVFLTEREWKAILIELKLKTAATKTGKSCYGYITSPGRS